MSEINWDDAPEWADRVMRSGGGELFWCNKMEYLHFSWLSEENVPLIFGDKGCAYVMADLVLVEMRPDNWKEGEKRMDKMAQNRNEGELYDETDNVNHPEHYQSDNGVECIDAIRAALGQEGFIAYCRGNAIKYNWRSGSKANHAEDLKKGAWYSNRAAEELENDK